MTVSAYSFLNCQATLSGPGGSIPLGNGSGAAEEGITIDNIEEKDLMTLGADGQIMHSLRASNAARATVRLLKTSPTNAQLMQMYNAQRLATGSWGQNVLTINDVARGDVENLTYAAFSKPPANTYSKDGAMMEWEFMGTRDTTLGTGTPSIL